MTYGSSIFTSWFQIICGSQQSQLEFVLWWCAAFLDMKAVNHPKVYTCTLKERREEGYAS